MLGPTLLIVLPGLVGLVARLLYVSRVEKLREQLELAQNRLIQTEKLAALGQLVAGVAHEINDPLTFVLNNNDVVQRDVRRALTEPTDSKRTLASLDEMLTRSKESLRRIAQMVKDLRNFARLDETEWSEANVNDGVGPTLSILSFKAKEAGVELRADLGDIPLIHCNPAKVNQVVMNLVSNAIDACSRGGHVALTTSRCDGGVQLQVRDDGGGIAPDVLPRIFNPFFTTKGVGLGTGLGLSISHGIVQEHGGRIACESVLSQGTVFTVFLPARRTVTR